jgi:hypothetical protein
MDKKSDDFKRLGEYVRNTHAATHQQYELEINNVSNNFSSSLVIKWGVYNLLWR